MGEQNSKKRFRRVYVEISNICNLKCDFCPTVERQSQVMDLALFRKIIGEIAPLTDEVCLHLMGEPLGHPQLGEFLEVCSQHQLPVNITTNGVLLSAARRELLLSAIVRQVNISVHSFEANFHEQDVAPYMRKVFAFAGAASTRRPDLYLNFRIWDFSDASSLSAKNAAIRSAIEAEYAIDISRVAVDLRRQKGYRIRGRHYLNFDTRFTWPSRQAPMRGEEGFCHGLSQHFGIHADGTVVPCCLDKEADINLGNCIEQSVGDVVGGLRAEGIRQGFARGVLVEDLCKRCTFIERFAGKASKLQQRPTGGI